MSGTSLGKIIPKGQSCPCPLADPAGRSVEHMADKGRNGATSRSLIVWLPETKRFETMTKEKEERKAPPATLSGSPDRELELKVKKHPNDKDAKADLGSDESMDASDPSSATQPGSSEPA